MNLGENNSYSDYGKVRNGLHFQETLQEGE